MMPLTDDDIQRIDAHLAGATALLQKAQSLAAIDERLTALVGHAKDAVGDAEQRLGWLAGPDKRPTGRVPLPSPLRPRPGDTPPRTSDMPVGAVLADANVAAACWADSPMLAEMAWDYAVAHLYARGYDVDGDAAT